MAVRAEDVDALAEAIVHGAEEKLVSELTTALVDDLAAGILDGGGRRTLGALARANRSRIDQALTANRARIAAEVYGEALSCLQEGDARDVAAIEAYYGAGAFAGASGASAGFQELAHQTARGLAEIVARQNLAMADAAERLWYEVAGEAITAKNQGLKPLDRIVADAVSRLAASGFETIDYESGVTSQIDVAVRRHVVSQVSQAGGEMTLARLRAVGHDLVVTSAHYGARPSHAEWQGRPCCVSGPKAVGGVQYPGLAALTGYGTVGGLKGVNCRHSIGPYFPGITELPDLSFPRESERFGLTSEQYYDALQRQRELERRVRGGKREIAAMERAGIGLENPRYVQKRLLLDRRQGALRSHCASTGLTRNYPREKAYGIGAQPRALKRLSRGKARLVKGMHPVTQEQIDELVTGKLSGVRFSAAPKYSARIGSFGLTSVKRDKDGRRHVAILIGKQRRPEEAELVDTLVHEELEARIALNRHSRELYYRLNAASDDERHAYIQKIIDRYVKMRGI